MSDNKKKIRELQEQIDALDRQLGLEIDKNAGRVGRLNMKHARFPFVYYVFAILLAGWWLLGGQFVPDIHAMTAFWALILAAVALLTGLYMTVRWAMQKGTANKGGFNADDTAKAAELRKKRDELKKEQKKLQMLEE